MNEKSDRKQTANQCARRRLLVRLTSATSAIGVTCIGASALPNRWVRPLVGQVVLPAHAATSSVATTSTTTTTTTTTTSTTQEPAMDDGPTTLAPEDIIENIVRPILLKRPKK